MTVSEKHRATAGVVFADFAAKFQDGHGDLHAAISIIAAALAAAEREGMRRAAMFAAIHPQYPIESDYDKGYAQGAKNAHDRIIREVNSNIHKKEDVSK